jgi:hypothetical protein
VLCGDATVLGDVERVLDGHLADLTWTDPPYNVDYANTPEGQASRQVPPYIMLLVLVWLTAIAISTSESRWQHREHARLESSRDPSMARSSSQDPLRG